MEKQFVIRVKEIDGQKMVGFDDSEFTVDELIVILNRCLHMLLTEYDCQYKT